jgi:homoserine O-acetyltransferase
MEKRDLENSVGVVETKTIRVVEADEPLKLVCGRELGPVDVAYETYGKLNERCDNAIYICHALSGNAHVAGYNSVNDMKPGWWDNMVGPGKAIDTDKYFVICSNCLGGCSGTTGPASEDPKTGRPYGLDFPIITMSDMVAVQKLLVEKLGVNQLLCVLGGSMGGMQVMDWAIKYPDSLQSAAVIASTTRLGPQAIAFDAVGRHSILADPWFQDGRYHSSEGGPDRGLAIARMIGHITYLSEQGMREKFGRELRNSSNYSYDFDSEFSVETYLAYQGQSFVERFDANSYLYITKAMDYFDLASEYGSLENAFSGCKCRFLVVSFTSDWLFTHKESEEIVGALAANSKEVSYCNIDSPYGHDAFLLEPEVLGGLVSGFIDTTFKRHGRELSPGGDAEQLGPVKVDPSKRVRVDYELIEQLIEPASKVLDVGSGDGELLARLTADKGITGEGIEVAQELVCHNIQRGLSTIHRDIEKGLGFYPNDSFDYVILSQTIQTIMNVEKVFAELLRVGKRVLVSFPNFAYWKCRVDLMFRGKAPRSKELPYQWYDSPNVHFCSLSDFEKFCRDHGIRIENKIPLRKTGISPLRFLPNILAEQAVYVTSKK